MGGWVGGLERTYDAEMEEETDPCRRLRREEEAAVFGCWVGGWEGG